MRPLRILVLFIVVLGCFVGCGPKRPEGVPVLHPTKITLNDADKPIADAMVLFAYQGTNPGNWSVSGKTDASGVADIETMLGEWKSKGAPEGEYTVYIVKAPVINEEKPAGLENDPVAEEKYFKEMEKKVAALPKEIPATLSDAAKSPLKITVAAGTSAELTVNVAEHKK